MNIQTQKPTNHQPHLSADELDALLNNDAHGNDAAVAHLESCPHCRSSLTARAADDCWWNDAHTFLTGSEPRWAPDASWSSLATGDDPQDAADIDETVRELLGEPRHPEMFGRLGRYDIERVIGHGGMGIVLKAHDSELNRPIAIKLLAGHLAHVGAARERLAREGRAAAAVVHEHVVGIYNVESNGKLPFLVMQYVPGRSLQQRVDEDGALDTEEILRIGMQAACGLAAAHRQGLVHRDVKPSNILLEDTVERDVLTDFGLARTFDDASLTHTGILAGTPHYMSPEQAKGEPIDQRSDLFSLGAVLYFMATDHPPFRAAGTMAVLNRICHDTHRPVWQRNSAIPDELSDIIDRLLEKNPSRRFASASEVQQQLAALLSRLQQHGLGRRRFRRLRTKRARRAVAGACAAMIAVAAAAISISLPGPVPKPQSQESKFKIAAATQAGVAAEGMHEKEFQFDFQAVRDRLIESARDPQFLQNAQDPWQQELESLKRDVAEFESERSTFDDFHPN
jgi:eukaryotic-like serine/threonine-protein kinase